MHQAHGGAEPFGNIVVQYSLVITAMDLFHCSEGISCGSGSNSIVWFPRGGEKSLTLGRQYSGKYLTAPTTKTPTSRI